jgi:hypothetical protein
MDKTLSTTTSDLGDVHHLTMPQVCLSRVAHLRHSEKIFTIVLIDTDLKPKQWFADDHNEPLCSEVVESIAATFESFSTDKKAVV